MTQVPLAEKPCIRVHLTYKQGDDSVGGNRLYFAYGGGSPTGQNCIAIATGISAAWGSHLAPIVGNYFTLEEVDVIDIASDTGLSGQWTGAIIGGMGGAAFASMVATNIEFNIARRYRGGKPRIFLPAPDGSAAKDGGHFNTGFVTTASAAMAAFIAEVEALNVGAVGTLSHVNLSYYKGFTNITNSSGREQAVPKYRPQALVDTVTGYACKDVMGCQKRRRTATTP